MPGFEQQLVWFAFFLVGVVVGFATYFIFRMSANQAKFEWSGALSVITTLAGGGFLSYLSEPLHFAAYGCGFFVGFFGYLVLWKLDERGLGSRATGPVKDDDKDPPHDRKSKRYRHPGLGSQAATEDDPK